LLSSHFNEKSSGKNFFIIMVSNEVDSINSHFKNNFE
jgi:hypothetical protein